MVKLFIDAGHGGSDSGAIGNGLMEKNVTLQIAKAIEAELKKYNNIEVRLSRTTDQTLSLMQRTNMANSWGADALISVHINSSASSGARGFESYIYPSVDSRTVRFQDILHTDIWTTIDNWSDHNRGKKRADFHMLRESSMIACLTENLFISNPSDANLLKSNSFINALAIGHANGIARYFGLKKNSIEPILSTPNPTGKNYYVQVGIFANKQNAEKLAEKLKTIGYLVYVKPSINQYIVQVGVFRTKELADQLKTQLEKAGYDVYVRFE